MENYFKKYNKYKKKYLDLSNCKKSNNFLDNIIKDVDWFEVVKIHNSSKIAKTININNQDLSTQNILLFIRSLSRIIIEQEINKQKKINKQFYSIIAGSTNITSDYDVTLVGEGAATVCENIINIFFGTYCRNLADVADSNIYIAPSFVINPGKEYKFNYVKLPGTDDQAFPLPITSVAIRSEINTVLKREKYIFECEIENLKFNKILCRYKKMIEKGKELERDFFYGESMKEEVDFWNLVHEIGFYAMEAYVTLSTIISVVVEIQMGKNLPEDNKLKPINYLISCFENMINFIEHSNLNSKILDEGILNLSKIIIVKNSKYILRIAKTFLNSVGLIDNSFITKDFMEIIERIVKQRSQPENVTDEDIILFKKNVCIPLLSHYENIKDILKNYKN